MGVGTSATLAMKGLLYVFSCMKNYCLKIKIYLSVKMRMKENIKQKIQTYIITQLQLSTRVVKKRTEQHMARIEPMPKVNVTPNKFLGLEC